MNRMNLQDAYSHPEIYNEPKPYMSLNANSYNNDTYASS